MLRVAWIAALTVFPWPQASNAPSLLLAKSGLQWGLYRATYKALMSMAMNTLKEHDVSEVSQTNGGKGIWTRIGPDRP